MSGPIGKRIVLLTIGLALLLTIAARLDPMRPGLTGRYFLSLDSHVAPVHETLDAPPSTARIAAAWNPTMPDTFSATWSGTVLAWTTDTYTFDTVADDAAHVYVDGRLVVDDGGAHGPEERAGSIRLTRGWHAVFIDYNQQGGGFRFEWRWARGGGTLRRVPAWALAPRQASGTRMAASAILWLTTVVVQFFACGLAAFGAGRWIVPWLAALKSRLVREQTWPTLRWVLLGSLFLNAMGVWWGLPDHWAAIEVVPGTVLGGIDQAFSNGWFDAYPPLHFYLLTIVGSPWIVLDWLGGFDLSSDLGETVLLLTFRAVSLAFGAGIVTAVCLVGTRAFGRRAGVLAAAAFALVAPFLYYAKTANTDVPYLFWFAAAMVFYLKLLDDLRLRDFVWFAVAATLSVCTKDQAYGLFLLMPVPIVIRLRTIADRRLWIAAGVSAAVFFACHNVIFNLEGFRQHLSFIVGPGSADYRVFDPTPAGQWMLLRLTAWLVQQSMGWPLIILAVIGVPLALSHGRLRRSSVWLLTPAVSYYVSFISVVLYDYDRFVIPICFVLAPFAGLALDRFLGAVTAPPRWRVAAVGAMFAYTVLYSGTVDVLMIGDSRYTAEAWLSSHVKSNETVGTIFDPEYLPSLDHVHHQTISTPDELAKDRPEYFVVNVDYARAVPPDSPAGIMLAGLENGTLGYRRTARFRHPSPWPWLIGAHHDLTGPRLEPRVFVILRNINPTIDVLRLAQRH